MDPAKALGIKRNISRRAAQHRPGSCQITVSIMVQCHRHLDQSLQKLLLRLRGGAPDVLQGLVGVEKGGAVEQLDAVAA